jgi:hypothetical protein
MEPEPKPMIDLKSHAVFTRDSDFDYDQYVYHYTRWERLLDIAHTGLRLNSLACMNDPRESKDWYLSHLSWDGEEPVDSGELWKAVARYKQQVKVASFSRDIPGGNPEDVWFGRGFARPRMWAQYAGNHTGVCIVMNRKGLDDAIIAQLSTEKSSWIASGPVEYVTRSRDDPSTRYVEIPRGNRDIAAIIGDHFSTHKQRIFFAKHFDWRDEAEYRWVYYDPTKPDDSDAGAGSISVRIDGQVSALVLGADYSDAHLPVAQTFAAALGLHGNVARCIWDRLSLHLGVFADEKGRWVPVRDRSTVALNVRVKISKKGT